MPTPKTETTSHYFFIIARNSGLDDPAVDTVYNEEFVQIFYEDAVVLKPQQRNLDRAADAERIHIAVHQGPMGCSSAGCSGAHARGKPFAVANNLIVVL